MPGVTGDVLGILQIFQVKFCEYQVILHIYTS